MDENEICSRMFNRFGGIEYLAGSKFSDLTFPRIIPRIS